MQHLQHQHLELQHRIETGPAALRGIAAAQRFLQHRPEQLEIHSRSELLQRIAFRRKLLQTVFNVPEPPLPLHLAPPWRIAANRESRITQIRQFPEVSTFGVIDRHLKNRPSRPPQWTQHAASPTPLNTAGAPSLGMFMAEMLRGRRTGFGRIATPSLGTDWSRTVERLLQVTYNLSFSHKATLGPVRALRGVTAMALLSFVSDGDELNRLWAATGARPPFDGVEIRDFDDRPVGISLVYIGIGSEDRSERDPETAET